MRGITGATDAACGGRTSIVNSACCRCNREQREQSKWTQARAQHAPPFIVSSCDSGGRDAASEHEGDATKNEQPVRGITGATDAAFGGRTSIVSSASCQGNREQREQSKMDTGQARDIRHPSS